MGFRKSLHIHWLRSPFKNFSMGEGAKKQSHHGTFGSRSTGHTYIGFGGRKNKNRHAFVVDDSVVKSNHSAYGVSAVRGIYDNPVHGSYRNPLRSCYG